MEEESLTELIIGCAIKVHTKLSAGLLESAYRTCLNYELTKVGLRVEMEKPVPIVYDGITLDCGYRIDLLVEDKIVIEIKSVEEISGVHMAQILTYLKLSGKRVGLLINFNVERLKYGIKRVVNTF